MLSKRPRVQAEVMLQTASWQNKMFSLHNHFQSQLFASSVFLELFYWAIEDLKLAPRDSDDICTCKKLLGCSHLMYLLW